MAPNDRDKLKHVTPPAGVRAQTARPVNESFEEETPVDGDPVTQINTRARNAAASSKAAFGAIGELRRELRASVDRDVRDHQSMGASISLINTKVDTLNEHVGDLRESMGEVRGTLHILVNTLEAERVAREDSARLKAITEAEIKKADALADAEIKKAEAVAEINVDAAEKLAELDETKDRAKHKRKIGLKVLAAFLTLLGLLGTLATRC